MAVKVVGEHEQGVVLRFGRYLRTIGSGLFFTIPLIDRMVKVDMRIITMDLPSQEAVTRNNVVVRIHAVICFKVTEPAIAVTKSLDHIRATAQVSRVTLGNILAESELDELLKQRERLGQRLQQTIDEQTKSWGVRVSVVEIRGVELAHQPGVKYTCDSCGNEATVTKAGSGSLACCGQEMVKVE
jgi:desulfoferrodoxin-like iron-binding protein